MKTTHLIAGKAPLLLTGKPLLLLENNQLSQ